jgi:chromate reductase
MDRHVAVIVGSLRKESFARKTARALSALAPASLKLDIVEIGALPLYNQDLETATPPEPWAAFRQRIADAQAVLFVTPEYNRSVPGCLKNAIDVGSRPSGKSVWKHKPGAVVSTSPGVMGGFGANHALRQCVVSLDVPLMQVPEAYIGAIDKALDAQGELTNPSTKEFLQKFMAAFEQWVRIHTAS